MEKLHYTLGAENPNAVPANSSGVLLLSVSHDLGGDFEVEGFKLKYLNGQEVVAIVSLVDTQSQTTLLNGAVQFGNVGTRKDLPALDDIYKFQKPITIRNGSKIAMTINTPVGVAIAAKDVCLSLVGFRFVDIPAKRK